VFHQLISYAASFNSNYFVRYYRRGKLGCEFDESIIPNLTPDTLYAYSICVCNYAETIGWRASNRSY